MQVLRKIARQLCDDERAADLTSWLTIYRVLQGTEFQSTLGSWIADAKPAFGPALTAGLEFVKKLDRTRIGESVGLREHYARRLNAALAVGRPALPSHGPDARSAKRLQRLRPQQRLLLANPLDQRHRRRRPAAAGFDAARPGRRRPVGLSLLAAHGRDLELLAAATRVAKQLHGFPVQLQ